MGEIRLARHEDIPQLILLGEEFALLSQPIHGFSVSRARIIEFTNTILNDPSCLGIVMVEDGQVVGIMAGVLNKIFFSEDVAMQELVWYVKKGIRGILMLDAFEKMALAKGADRVIVGNKPQYYDLDRFYRRRGYTLLENQYVKTVREVRCL